MKTLTFEELEVGMIVVMSKAGKDFPGLAGRIFKVIALDDPYIALETGKGAAASKHMVVDRDAEFVRPSDEMIATMLPEESWPQVVG